MVMQAIDIVIDFNCSLNGYFSSLLVIEEDFEDISNEFVTTKSNLSKEKVTFR